MDSNELLKDVTWISKDILKNPILENGDSLIKRRQYGNSW